MVDSEFSRRHDGLLRATIEEVVETYKTRFGDAVSDITPLDEFLTATQEWESGTGLDVRSITYELSRTSSDTYFTGEVMFDRTLVAGTRYDVYKMRVRTPFDVVGNDYDVKKRFIKGGHGSAIEVAVVREKDSQAGKKLSAGIRLVWDQKNRKVKKNCHSSPRDSREILDATIGDQGFPKLIVALRNTIDRARAA